MLGIKEVYLLNHKSGELSQVSSNEIRNQLFGLIRHYKPQIIFHPDPWIHYEPDWDQFFQRGPRKSSHMAPANTSATSSPRWACRR